MDLFFFLEYCVNGILQEFREYIPGAVVGRYYGFNVPRQCFFRIIKRLVLVRQQFFVRHFWETFVCAGRYMMHCFLTQAVLWFKNDIGSYVCINNAPDQAHPYTCQYMDFLTAYPYGNFVKSRQDGQLGVRH